MKSVMDKHMGLLVGRVFAVLVLFVAGLDKLRLPAATADFMRSAGMPGAGEGLALVVGLIEVAGAVAILVGWNTRTVALFLAAYLVPVTWFTHLGPLARAAAAGNEAARVAETFATLKNLSLMGALVIVASVGPGRHSVDGK